MDSDRKREIRKKVDEQIASVRAQIVEALTKAGHVVNQAEDIGSWKVDGESVSIRIKADSHGDMWYSSLTGAVRVIVGDYGQRKQFPVKKDGTFRLDDLVSAVANVLQQKRHTDATAKERAAQHGATVEIKNRLVSEFYAKHGSVEHHFRGVSYEEFQVPKEERVHLTASASGLSLEVYELTEEQGRRLLQTCKDIGLIGGKS